MIYSIMYSINKVFKGDKNTLVFIGGFLFFNNLSKKHVSLEIKNLYHIF